MINKNFYPTPAKLIDKMLAGVDINAIGSVLEPSAGKGDLADGYCEKCKIRSYGERAHKGDIDCIELDHELQATLKGKGYRVVHNDFLTYNTQKHYDLIIMNPPFDNGDLHLLKALKMQENGGAVICLLNAETLKNPYSNPRKELIQKLNDYNAEIEYIKNAFVDAERPTGVEVALVKVLIPNKEFECNFLNDLKQQETYEELYDKTNTELTRFASKNEYIELAVEQYNLEVKLGIKLIREYEAMKPFIKNEIVREGDKDYSHPILTLMIGSQYDSNKKIASINEYVKEVRYKYWKALFNNPQFTKKLTTNLVQELHKKLEALQDYDFSVWNIMTIQEELMKNTIKGIEQTILDLFENFSHKYSYLDETSKNIHYYNGWKTNKGWKINKKVIIPLNAWTWSGRFDPIWSVCGRLQDIIKVFDYLDGGRTTDIDIGEVLDAAGRKGQTAKIPLKYFNVTFYKKGTCHIEFLDLKLLEKFNLFGSQKKGWLPPSFFKKQYKDFNQEERQVVDDFCGEAKYNDFMKNKGYYLVDTNTLLLDNNN